MMNHNFPPSHPLKMHFAKALMRSLKQDTIPFSTTDLASWMTEPPTREQGHIAFPCFRLAKEFKKAPPKIAMEIAEAFGAAEQGLRIIAQGPYLNAFFSNEALMQSLSEEQPQAPLAVNPKKVCIEYSQPNTHKILHVGHMRNMCLGDALARILCYALGPQNVVRTTYPGDMGTHVAKTLLWMKKHGLRPPESEHPGAWLGNLYVAATEALDKLDGPELTQAKNEVAQTLKKIEDKDPEFFPLWQETRKWSLELMQEAYQWAGVEFDRWDFESKEDRDSVTLMKRWHHSGFLIEDQGALGLQLDQENLGFALLLKSDGSGLYATKDISLAIKRRQELQAEAYFYVVDARQALHFQQVFAVLKRHWGDDDCPELQHVQYEMVELPDGAMSSRKGNIVPLMTLVEQMENHLLQTYLNQRDWSDREKRLVAQKVAVGAIKYGMTRVDNPRKIVFALEEWLKLDGETGPYLQYVGARIKSLLRKANNPEIGKTELSHPLEKELILTCCKLPEVIASCANQMKTHHLTQYLFTLCRTFNSYYAQVQVGQDKHRIELCKKVLVTLTTGLDLLGIEIPDRM